MRFPAPLPMNVPDRESSGLALEFGHFGITNAPFDRLRTARQPGLKGQPIVAEGSALGNVTSDSLALKGHLRQCQKYQVEYDERYLWD